MTIVFKQQEVAGGAALKHGLAKTSIVIVVGRPGYVLFNCHSDLFFDLTLGFWVEHWVLAVGSLYGDVLSSYALEGSTRAKLAQPGG